MLTDERVTFSALPLKLSEDIIPYRQRISPKMIARVKIYDKSFRKESWV